MKIILSSFAISVALIYCFVAGMQYERDYNNKCSNVATCITMTVPRNIIFCNNYLE